MLGSAHEDTKQVDLRLYKCPPSPFPKRHTNSLIAVDSSLPGSLPFTNQIVIVITCLLFGALEHFDDKSIEHTVASQA